MQYPGLLIFEGSNCCGILGFFWYSSWCFCQLSQLHLWWLVWPLLYYSTSSGIQSGDLCTYSSFLWSSSRYYSHLVWPHLWWHTCWSLSPELSSLVQVLFVPFACVGSSDPVRVLRLFHNEYTEWGWIIYCWDSVQLVTTKSNMLLYLSPMSVRLYCWVLSPGMTPIN